MAPGSVGLTRSRSWRGQNHPRLNLSARFSTAKICEPSFQFGDAAEPGEKRERSEFS